MNHIYRIVFNCSQGIWHAVSENARRQGKGSRRLKPVASRRTQSLALMAIALITALTAICGTTWLYVGYSDTGTLSILTGAGAMRLAR